MQRSNALTISVDFSLICAPIRIFISHGHLYVANESRILPSPPRPPLFPALHHRTVRGTINYGLARVRKTTEAIIAAVCWCAR